MTIAEIALVLEDQRIRREEPIRNVMFTRCEGCKKDKIQWCVMRRGLYQCDACGR